MPPCRACQHRHQGEKTRKLLKGLGCVPRMIVTDKLRSYRAARGGVLEQYVEHDEQAQRSNDGPIACFGRQVVRKAG